MQRIPHNFYSFVRIWKQFFRNLHTFRVLMSFRSCFRKQGAPNGEDFCPQTRRFSAAILTDCKGKQRSMRAKRPFGRCAMLMKTASYFFPAKFVENPGFPTVFHTWFLPGSVCGKLGCQKFQRGEALLPQARNAAENKFLASTFFSKKGSSTPFLSRFSLFSRFGIHRV